MKRGIIIAIVALAVAGLGFMWWSNHTKGVAPLALLDGDKTPAPADDQPGDAREQRESTQADSERTAQTEAPHQSGSAQPHAESSAAPGTTVPSEAMTTRQGDEPSAARSDAASTQSRPSQPDSPSTSVSTKAVASADGPAAGSAPSSAADAERHAKAFVDKLKKSASTSLSATNADHFVSSRQAIKINAKRIVEELSLKDLKLDNTLRQHTPITLIKEVPQIDLSSPEKLIADAAGNLEKKIQILAGDEVQTVSVREALKRHGSAGSAVSVVKVMEYLEPTTLSELLAQAPSSSEGWGHMVRVIKGRYRPEVARVADLLAGIKGVTEDSVFYVHSVRDGDTQGVWGIIHDGLIQNFARGMAIRRGEDIDTYKVHIPQDADEREADNSSSFLGRLIDDKARNSVVYNFRLGRMSRDPDYIAPGNEIVIINFSPDELVSIYKHFLNLQSHAS